MIGDAAVDAVDVLQDREDADTALRQLGLGKAGEGVELRGERPRRVVENRRIAGTSTFLRSTSLTPIVTKPEVAVPPSTLISLALKPPSAVAV